MRSAGARPFVVALGAAFSAASAASACSATYTTDTTDAGAGPGCVARTCSEDTCGTVADGCGGALDCGRCAGGSQCVDNACSCAPRTCKNAGATCGQLTDGCTGNVLFCGECGGADAAPGDADAGDAGDAGPRLYCGPENRCVPVPCTAKTKDAVCTSTDKKVKPCGLLSDGCGGLVDCGTTATCTGTGQTCGGGGTAGVCGCTPKPTGVVCAGAACGARPNGCGGSVYCGSCR